MTQEEDVEEDEYLAKLSEVRRDIRARKKPSRQRHPDLDRLTEIVLSIKRDGECWTVAEERGSEQNGETFPGFADLDEVFAHIRNRYHVNGQWKLTLEDT